MQPIHTFNVIPKLPESLEPLRDMVYNLWWTWQPDARKLFRDLDHTLWDQTNHNPLRMLQLSRQQRLDEVARNDDFLREMRAVYARYQAYMSDKKTYGKGRTGTSIASAAPIAYFSAE